MFEKILLAVDGSEHSHQATAAASEIATKSEARSTCCTSTRRAWSARGDEHGAQGVVDQAIKHSSRRRRGVRQAVSARAGSVAPTIIDAARSFGCDLIVMGTRGLSDFSGLLVGSIAHKVIHHADCPVLVVR